jgi:hypothetical protein
MRVPREKLSKKVRARGEAAKKLQGVSGETPRQEVAGDG